MELTTMESIDALDLAQWIKNGGQPAPILLDVREFSEVEICQIPGSVHMSMYSVPDRMGELKNDVPIVCICHHGVRSRKVADFLIQQGFLQVINLSGGIHAWATHVDRGMAKY